MKKIFLPIVTVLAVAGCKSSQPESKYDFSNVESTSLNAIHPSPTVVVKDTVQFVRPINDPLRNQHNNPVLITE